MTARLVTIFGGSGFLGRHLVQRLVRTGATIRVCTRDPEKAHMLRPLGDVGQIVPWAADIRRPETVAHAVADADACVNLVGVLYERGKSTFEAVHVDGATTVANAAAAAGCDHLVQVSALGASLDSDSKYARSKAAGEAAVLGAFPKATILRPSVVFGPEDSFFNMFASLTSFSPALPVIGAPCPPKLKRDDAGKMTLDLFGDGGPKMQPVYVGDVVDAITQSLNGHTHEGKTYSLGGPTVYSFKDLMTLVLTQTERKRLLFPLPFFLAEMQATFLQLLPKPLLTPDQVTLLRTDNVVPTGQPGLDAFGITPTAAEAIVPSYLRRFVAPGRKDVLA